MDFLCFAIPRKVKKLILSKKIYLAYLPIVHGFTFLRLKSRKRFSMKSFLKIKYLINRQHYVTWNLFFGILKIEIYFRVKNYCLSMHKLFFVPLVFRNLYLFYMYRLVVITVCNFGKDLFQILNINCEEIIFFFLLTKNLFFFFVFCFLFDILKMVLNKKIYNSKKTKYK